MLEVGLKPLEPYVNAVTDWRCLCLKCDQVVTSRYNRVQQGSGCPLCAYKAGGMKIRLSESRALEKLREYNLEALEPYQKSDMQWKCRCLLCGETVYPKLKNLQRGDGGCFNCGIKKAGKSNSLTQSEAFRIAMDAGFEPLEPYVNALTKWKLQHKVCNAIVFPKLNSIQNTPPNRSGCAVCSGHQVELGFNDLNTTNPTLAREAFGWDTTKFTSGSNAKKRWVCDAGHSWSAVIADRASGHGCPSCTKNGYDPNKDGYLYFLWHPIWEMYQIGITNNPDNRIKSHRSLGWELQEIRGPIDGLLAQKLEASVLRMLKAQGADLANDQVAGKYDGYSEAWSKSTFEVKSIVELVQLTESIADDSND